MTFARKKLAVESRYDILRETDPGGISGDRDQFVLDILVGLSADRKSIPSKYFYDAAGTKLFQQITRLEEYYPTGCEKEILVANKDAIARYVESEPFHLVELGAGFSEKTLILVKHFTSLGLDFRYVPIDISESAMRNLVECLAADFPGLPVHGLVADYYRGLKLLSRNSRKKNLVLFLGSSIGNFSHAENRVFMRNVWNSLHHDDVVLIGFDLKKDIDTMLRAYNDSAGVTREFNLNLLRRINRELGGTFDVAKFRHFGTYDVFSGAMESYLVSLEHQVVHIEAIGRSFEFKEWEPIHTEYSYKYLTSDIEELAGETGFEVSEHLTDNRQYFANSIWHVHKPTARRLRSITTRTTAGS